MSLMGIGSNKKVILNKDLLKIINPQAELKFFKK
jgi:hypothetical protein